MSTRAATVLAPASNQRFVDTRSLMKNSALLIAALVLMSATFAGAQTQTVRHRARLNKFMRSNAQFVQIDNKSATDIT